MIATPSIWTLVSDGRRGAPFAISIGRAVAQAFPPIIDDTLPERMKAAIQALEDRDAITSKDRLPGSAR